MKKILFLTGKLQDYRIPILNQIVELSDCELTVGHSGKPRRKATDKFNEVILTERTFAGLTVHSNNLADYCASYDVVVAMFYVQKLSFVRLAISRSRSFKLIYWGIGVRASQRSKYDSPGLSNLMRNFLVRKADAMLFYSDYPVEKYARKGISRKKLFVMHNTVEVADDWQSGDQKTHLLFIGTLNRSKKIIVLLESYKNAYTINSKVPPLKIIGNGPDYEIVISWINENKLFHKIKVLGAIFEESILKKHFSTAIACISPGQAGLSVLKSMGYGVPFITQQDAITGGELFNIKNGVNGVLFKHISELKDIILDIGSNQSKFVEMGLNARDHYIKFRTPEIMAQGFLDAVDFVLLK